jgi:RimJ/RimL family protein N-acetyltransferase
VPVKARPARKPSRRPVRTDRAERLRLSDGRELLIRPIDPADAEPIAASFQLLNEEEVRRRFLHLLKALSEIHLQHLTHPDPDSEFVVVAAEPLPAGEALVPAVARLARDNRDRSRAEFGILVSHFVTGLGLGRVLMLRLIEWARQNGVTELWSDVVENNTAMLDLATQLGFRKQAMFDSPGLIRVSLALSA